MLMMLTASLPSVTNTTTMTPRIFLPMPRQRLLWDCTTSALSKNVSSRSAKSSPCLSRLASRFGSSHTIFMEYCSYNLIVSQRSRRGHAADFSTGETDRTLTGADRLEVHRLDEANTGASNMALPTPTANEGKRIALRHQLSLESREKSASTAVTRS